MDTNKEYINHYEIIKEEAVKQWETEKNEVFNGIEDDPVIKLLLQALAYQSYSIENNIKEYKENIITELRDRLIPYHLIKATPSFSIIETKLKKEYEESSIIIDENSFFELAKSKKKYKFFPLFKTKIINAHISNKQINSYDNILIELTSDTGISDLSGVSFYVDSAVPVDISVKYMGQELKIIKPDQYHDFPFSQWFNNDHLLLKNNQHLFGNYNYWQEIFAINNVQMFYIDRYDANEIRIENETQIELEITFYSEDNFFEPENCDIYINCIPVVNVEKKEIKLSHNNPVMPLVSESEYFLHLLCNKNIEDPEEFINSFVIRHHDVERYNQSKLLTQLRDLLNRYRHDYYAFKDIPGLKNSDRLDELRENFEEISGIINDSNESDYKKPYVILKLNEDISIKNTALNLEYLCTSGELANDIENTQTKKEIYFVPANLDKANTRLLLKTSGGKSAVKTDEEKNDIAKYYFLTKDRLVTLSDLKNYCYKELGNNIKNIDLKRENNQLLISILLDKSCRIKDDENELKLQACILRKKIELRSSNIIPIKIEIQKERI
ncbi:MAG: hypothetical protein LBQ22_06955 [Bacteroidales bacterium]|jgi:hypothetical protein|nr:hypothetical protein [Bacteroidales bacterium]